MLMLYLGLGAWVDILAAILVGYLGIVWGWMHSLRSRREGSVTAHRKSRARAQSGFGFSAARIKEVEVSPMWTPFAWQRRYTWKAPLWTGDPEIVEFAGSLQCEVVDLRTADS